MKKYVLYIGLVVLGLVAGWLLFGEKSEGKSAEENAHNHEHQVEGEQIWTCSMHPQIRQNEPGDCPICGMDLIPLEENANENPLVFEMTDEAVEIANVQTTVIGSGNGGNHKMTLSGRIKADETLAASIVSHVSGRIERLFVAYEGQEVQKGQKVATIYSPDLVAAQKELLEAKKIKATSPELYNAAYQKLRNWKLTTAQIASIEGNSELLETFTVYAQHAGVITTKRVAVGDYVKEGGVLFDLQSLDRVWAVFDAYETSLNTISKGDQITFTTASHPNEKFTAEVSFIDPLIDPTTRTVAIRADVTNKSGKLKPDMFIEGAVNKNRLDETVLCVPKSAVLWTGKRSVVYVKLPNATVPSFEYHEVEIGEAQGDFYTVNTGLNAGDEVVIHGAFVIDASAQLNNQASMMNQNLLEDNEPIIEQTEEQPTFENVPKAFIKQLDDLTKGYYQVKNALVNDQTEKTEKSAEQLIHQLKKVDMKLVKGKAHDYWMQQQAEIEKSASEIKTAKTIKKQRKSFHDLSAAIINTVKAYGLTTESYVQYCPMAHKNNGGFWLSESDEIMNPYFGESMLTCGEVREVLAD